MEILPYRFFKQSVQTSLLLILRPFIYISVISYAAVIDPAAVGAQCELPCCCPDTGMCLPPEEGECDSDGDGINDCTDKYGNPVDCPSGDDGSDGGGGDPPDTCYDKYNNEIPCGNCPPDDPNCCDPSSPTYNATIAAAASCSPPKCNGETYDPEEEQCCDNKVIAKTENCDCTKTVREGSWRITTYFSPIASDFSGTTVTITFDDGSTAKCTQGFIDRIQNGEGWGALTSVNSSFYVGAYNSTTDRWEKGSCAEGNRDNCLTKFESLATGDFSNGKKAHFITAPHHGNDGKICGQRDDSGAASEFYMGANHIDLYVGTLHLAGKGTPAYENFSQDNVSVAVEK